MSRTFTISFLLTALVGVAACTVHQSAQPGLTGPSEFATALSVTATPDSMNQDGASQSAIIITAHGASGQLLPGLSVRVDMAVNGVMQDFGTLSARNLVTGNDGRASTIYTAPPAPPLAASGSVNSVSIVATAVASNALASSQNSSTAQIRLTPVGVILPPAGTPKASFTVSPSAPLSVGVASTFDASASCPATDSTGVCVTPPTGSIASYAWSFGDGSSASGKVTSHAYAAPGTFTATLTVTNDRGVSGSTSQSITVASPTAPTADFVFSPSQPAANQTVVFNADTSKSALGHAIVQFSWNFGDGGTASGLTASHAFAVAGTYAVTLSVLDDTGQKASTSKTVTVGSSGANVSAPVARFVFSPSAPGVNQSVFFNASSSSVQSGHTLTYAWDFGDGNSGSGVTPSHAYGRAGTFTVTLLVTDDTGQQNTTASSVTVSATSAQIVALFDFSPTNPSILAGTNNVHFDATASSSPAGGLTYAWDFGDGSAAGSGLKPSHVYTLPATYVVRLTVTDSALNTATTTVNVTVAP